MTKLFLTLLNVGITAGWLILAAWGMWDIKPALYDNEVKNCLVATYGIQGLAENQADSVAGAAASYEQVIDEYRDMCRTIFIWICKLKTGMLMRRVSNRVLE